MLAAAATVAAGVLLALVLGPVALAVAAPPRAAAPGSAGAVARGTSWQVAGWVWPLSPRPAVLRHFEAPSTPYGSGHRGVDLAGRAGQPVLAAGDGRVSYAGVLAGRGVVSVTHGALRTTYEPVRASVSVGDRVLAGDTIGHLETRLAHCVPTCLHWGLLRGRVYLDPLLLVGAGPVRLLPLWGTVAAPAAGRSAAGPSAARLPSPTARLGESAGDTTPLPVSVEVGALAAVAGAGATATVRAALPAAAARRRRQQGGGGGVP